VQPATETTARAPEPWCVIRDSLSLASYVSNSALRPHSLTAGAIWDRPKRHCIGA